jgi:hypothetical protein
MGIQKEAHERLRARIEETRLVWQGGNDRDRRRFRANGARQTVH